MTSKQWCPNLFSLPFKREIPFFNLSPAQRRKGQPHRAQRLLRPHLPLGAGPGSRRGLSHPADVVCSCQLSHRDLCPWLPSFYHLQALLWPCSPGLFPSAFLAQWGWQGAQPTACDPHSRLSATRGELGLRPTPSGQRPFLSPLAPQPFRSIPGLAVPIHR